MKIIKRLFVPGAWLMCRLHLSGKLSARLQATLLSIAAAHWLGLQGAGIDGQGLINAIVAQASRESGWVAYDITNRATGKVQSKMAYVQQVDAVFVGCRVYKNLAA